MKTYKILLPFLVLLLTLASCKKFLDIDANLANGVNAKFISTAAECQGLLDAYPVMNKNYPSDGQASSDDSYLGDNIFPGGFDQENQDLYTWKSTAVHDAATFQWIPPYQAVYYANLVLQSLDRNDVKSSADAATLNNIRGSALFFRAFSLWNVAQLYAKPYGSTSSTDPGIPARTSADLNDAFGRGTVKETYDRITKDLQDAIGLLNETSLQPSRPNKAAAYAMLARVYLSMEDYGQALSNAGSCLSLRAGLLDYNTLDVTTVPPFTRFSPVEVLFNATMKAARDSKDQLLSPGTAGNPVARINAELYNQYADNDLRKSIFFKQNSGAYAGTYRFTGNYDPTDAALFNGLATDEMYLVRAECYARAGNKDAALKDLNDLLVTRFKKVPVAGVLTSTYVPYSADNAGDALKIILKERRKELVMRGQRWTDLRRLNKDSNYAVTLSRTTTTGNFTLPPNDLRYTLLIPQEVITKSAGTSNITQNPRSPE